jgi:hypothetical protein
MPRSSRRIPNLNEKSKTLKKPVASHAILKTGRINPKKAQKTDKNRQDFSHREADAKSLLDEALRRGREEREEGGCEGECENDGRGE